jgi:hypothetical protein
LTGMVLGARFIAAPLLLGFPGWGLAGAGLGLGSGFL